MKYIIIKSTHGTNEEVMRHWEKHLHYLEALQEGPTLLAAGTFEDGTGGMMVVESSGLEDAISIARNDPLVQAGVQSYHVHGWLPSVKLPLNQLGQDRASSDTKNAGPLQVPPSEENFRVIEAASIPRYADFMVTCFAPEHMAKDNPTRLDYLRVAGKRGLHKLLLLHEDKLAGQIEYAPPEVSGLPVSGAQVTVIHCLWVLDAFTGLDGGRRLLAACAENVSSDSLATIAYNARLPWLSRAFFESQDFVVVDQVETGRFFGNVPIVAYLLWRPLKPEAQAPTWNREQLLDGVGFCPMYPWLFGKRLYWGREFDYHAMLVKEGLRRKEILQQLPCLGSKRSEKWTIVKIGIPEADLNRALGLIQTALLAEPTYYAHIYGRDRLFVVYPDRIFRLNRDEHTWGEAIRYGLEQGIPESELTFKPLDFEDEPF